MFCHISILHIAGYPSQLADSSTALFGPHVSPPSSPLCALSLPEDSHIGYRHCDLPLMGPFDGSSFLGL